MQEKEQYLYGMFQSCMQNKHTGVPYAQRILEEKIHHSPSENKLSQVKVQNRKMKQSDHVTSL